MPNKQFNLSLLESDLTLCSTPLRECLDYAAVFDLIREADAPQIKNETKYNDLCTNSPISSKKIEPEVRTPESIIKSLHRRRNCNRIKSPGLLKSVQQQRSLQYQTHSASVSRSRSLGAVKPGRSFINKNKKKESSIAHDETSTTVKSEDDSEAEKSKDNLQNEIPAQSADENDEDYNVLPCIKNDLEDIEAHNGNSQSSSKADLSRVKTNDLPDSITDDESIVESSQSTVTSSELRNKLSLRRRSIKTSPTKMVVIKEELENKSAELSEGENENFSLMMSPGSKSGASTVAGETNSPPARMRKRKAICRVSPLKGLTQNVDNLNDETGGLIPRKRSRKITLNSPLKGLTQELENCMRDDNYIEMCDSETESLSFTFETIQLLNDYDDCNDETNTKLLNNIFSSPVNGFEGETSTNTNNAVSTVEEPVEDPLSINTDTKEELFDTNDERFDTKDDLSDTNDDLSDTKEDLVDTKKNLVQRNKKFLTLDDNSDKDYLPARTRRTRSTSSTYHRRKSERVKTEKQNDAIYYESDEDPSAGLADELAAAKKKSALSAEILNKLHDLAIRLRHEVLPQHKIESTAGSCTLSYKQQQMFLEYAPLNKSTYSSAEDKIIQDNWNSFCDDHNWDPTNYRPFLFLKHGNTLIMSSLEERRKFVQYLANGLPNRPLYSVYSRFRLLYSNYYAAGLRYTNGEDTKIIAYMKANLGATPAQKCSELSKMMNRSRVSIWKRYKKLTIKNCPIGKTKRVLTKVEWDLSLAEEFITRLLDVTLSDELMDLKDAFLPRVVWLKMEEKMKIRYDIMQRFWEQKLHLQLFVTKKISFNEIKIRLIEYMHMKQIGASNEIQWSTVVKYFDGCTIPFLRYVFNHLTMTASTILQTRDFKEIMQWLHGKKINELRYTLTDRCLPRITYVDKTASFVSEDLERIRLISEKSEKSDNDSA